MWKPVVICVVLYKKLYKQFQLIFLESSFEGQLGYIIKSVDGIILAILMPGEYICDNGESSNIAKISTNLNEDRPLRICIVGGGGYLGLFLKLNLFYLYYIIWIIV